MMSMRCVILFSDVHDFSKAAMLLGEEREAAFLQELYESTGESIVRSHGTIVKYLGDGLLAVFADKAEQAAVRCALQMRQAVAALVAKWGLPATTELEVGVSAGRVVRGQFGHASHRAEDVFGEEVSVAAAIGHHRGVAVTQAVYERIKDAFSATPLEARTLKWREEPIPVWAVTAEIAREPARG